MSMDLLFGIYFMLLFQMSSIIAEANVTEDPSFNMYKKKVSHLTHLICSAMNNSNHGNDLYFGGFRVGKLLELHMYY